MHCSRSCEAVDAWASRLKLRLLSSAARAAYKSGWGCMPREDNTAVSVATIDGIGEIPGEHVEDIKAALYRAASNLGTYVGKYFADGAMLYQPSRRVGASAVDARFVWVRYGTTDALGLVAPECVQYVVDETAKSVTIRVGRLGDG